MCTTTKSSLATARPVPWMTSLTDFFGAGADLGTDIVGALPNAPFTFTDGMGRLAHRTPPTASTTTTTTPPTLYRTRRRLAAARVPDLGAGRPLPAPSACGVNSL